MTNKDDEMVLCLPCRTLEQHLGMLPNAGFIAAGQGVVDMFVEMGEFRPRGDCENNLNFKQIIPYVVFRSQQQDSLMPWVFRYNRTKAGGEGRLVGKASVGIGGHVNPPDLAAGPGLSGAIARELEEEVGTDPANDIERITFRGFVNNDSDPVGLVHIGAVYTADLTHPCLYPREPSIGLAHFVPGQFLGRLVYDFETWSRILIANGTVYCK